jgi:pyocin large subunit-like protein
MVDLARVVAAAAAAAAVVLLPCADSRADDCLTDWGMAGQIVRRENLITVEEVSRSLAADGIGKLVKTTLCRTEAGYFYRLVIRSPTGQLRTTVMTARGR